MDGKFSVNTFDLKTTRWQAFEYRSPRHRAEVKICACDGGLVCFLYESTEVSLEEQRAPSGVCMSVWNPVTGGEVRLPPLPVSDFSQCAAKLYVDRQTNSFRVLFVTTVVSKDRISAHVFDSVAWEWETAEKSSTPILWSSHHCAGPVPKTGLFNLLGLFGETLNPLDGLLAGFCSYDSAAGIFKRRPSEYTNRNGTCVKTVACTEDKCFLVLQNARASAYKISEYHSGGKKDNKFYRCPPLAKFPQGACKLELQACKNLLILDAHSHQQQRRWLLDLSTGKWRDLPALPEDKTSFHVEYVLCELQWNVCPQSSNRK